MRSVSWEFFPALARFLVEESHCGGLVGFDFVVEEGQGAGRCSVEIGQRGPGPQTPAICHQVVGGVYLHTHPDPGTRHGQATPQALSHTDS